MSEVLSASMVITGEATIADGAVVIGDRTIEWVGPLAGLPPEYAALPRTDYPDATILPGLIDSHVHLGFDGGPGPVERMRSETDGQQLVLMLRSARELLGVGVTTARDLGARSFLDVVVRDAIAADLARGPRMVVSARPITVTGGHCWFMGGEADGIEEIRKMVRTHHKHGADWIKVMSTGGFMTSGSAPWYAQFSGPELGIIVDEAGRVDTPVAAHAHGLYGIRRAVDAGVRTLEHCSFVTETNERKFDEGLAADIAEKGIFVCPTINVNAPYVAELTGVAVGEFVLRMHEMGVRIIAGTDAGIDNLPHHQYLGGLEYLVTLGFRPEQVIAIATTEAAAGIGVDQVTGRLVAGFDADLIVVDGDPRADITVLGRLLRVVARGHDYLPDSGRFDVAAPGTPFASLTDQPDLTLLTAATKRRG